jgi:hypothetical protein
MSSVNGGAVTALGEPGLDQACDKAEFQRLSHDQRSALGFTLARSEPKNPPVS